MNFPKKIKQHLEVDGDGGGGIRVSRQIEASQVQMQNKCISRATVFQKFPDTISLSINVPLPPSFSVPHKLIPPGFNPIPVSRSPLFEVGVFPRFSTLPGLDVFTEKKGNPVDLWLCVFLDRPVTKSTETITIPLFSCTEL